MGALALVVAGLIVGLVNERAFRVRQAQSLTAQAEVLAATVEPALVFQDPSAAGDLVRALRPDARVEAAGIYDDRGARVAEFGRGGERPPGTVAEARPAPGVAVAVTAPVLHEGVPIGTVYLRAAPEPLGDLVQRHAGTALLLLMAVLVLAGAHAAQAAQARAAAESQARALELADMNERLQQQIRRRETAEEALLQAQKMETLGQLTGGIAHDFNNLLQTVQGAFDVISSRPSDTGRVEKWARMGTEATQRGSRLTSQLLAFSRSQKLELRPVDVREVVDRLRELLPTVLGTAVNVVFDVHETEAWVIGDATQLELAVLNLCINARDAMPDGGEVRVSTHSEFVTEDSNLQPGNYLVLSVADTGVGMPADIQKRAFDPFFTTKGVGKGTGLGLAQVYGIAKQAGGLARLHSETGTGTTVSVYLPVAKDNVVAPSDEVASQAGNAGARILVVDDDAGVLSYVSDALTTLGYACFPADNGPAGLEILERERIDLVLADYAMPGMSGAAFARLVLAQRPELPILFASGYADSEALEQALGRPAQLLRKPFDRATLGARVALSLSTPPTPKVE
ncbi:MAG: ATP-binding protein [Phenylobacterium sp.]|uniref:ATP-binding protein n=1 Tax=Phenylobacterium sp. TaxID=1871053 RepID=UPI0027367CB9|nr:ATP-binding protein [Phenylobacterium sp.]MDP3175932.1 ATP-binding protein [Phenylobacterium sp.]